MKIITALFALALTTFTMAQKENPMTDGFTEVPYSVGEKQFTGYLVRPPYQDSNTVTVMIVPEWWGVTEYPKMRAKQLAAEGYIAMVVDMYGTDVVAHNPEEAKKLSGEVYADPKVLMERFMAAYHALIIRDAINKNRMAAIGYCFGGSVVLNAAKMGAPLDAVASFHGGLDGPPADSLKAAVLVMNGDADKFISAESIQKFNADMKQAHADYTFIGYKDATHAFTNPESTENGKKFNMPIAYNEAADKKSWSDFRKWLDKKVK